MVGAFVVLVGLVAAERLFELRLARRNAVWALARGGIERGRGHYPMMAAMHTLFLVSAPLEVVLLDRPFNPALGLVMLAVVGSTMALRYWVIATLGPRWNTRVICVPGLPPVTSGPFRYLRHPNYLAVVLELAALPLVHGAWWTALGFSIANLAVLRVRIRVEDQAMAELCGAR